MRSTEFKVNDFAKINRMGYEKAGMVQITAVNASSREATFRMQSGAIDTLYQAHLYKDAQTVRATFAYKQQMAEKMAWNAEHAKQKRQNGKR